MTPDEIKTIHELLCNRVQPQSAREGVAIFQLAGKLVSHFAKLAASQQDKQDVGPSNPPPAPTL